MRSHRNPADLNRVIGWARQRLERQDFIIIDTETTGVSDQDEIIQIGAIDYAGQVLLNTLVKPTTTWIAPDAVAIHGITMEMLNSAPPWTDIAPSFFEITKDKIVIAYNADFDGRMLRQTQAKHGWTGNGIPFEMQCAMAAYSTFVGEWNSKYNNYKWQKLPRNQNVEGYHDAVRDCLLTLKLMQKMSAAGTI